MTSEPGETQSRRNRTLWGFQLFVILALLWLALSGLDGWLPGLVGAAVGAVVGAVLVPAHPYPWRPHRLIAFFVWFLIESCKGGVDVAWRALHPAMPIKPEFLDYRLDLPPGQPRTLMISTISLLPGTLSADLVDDNTVVIHSIAPDSREVTERLERKIQHLFSLERGSSD